MLLLAAGLLAAALAPRAGAQDVQVLPGRGAAPAPAQDDLPALPAITALSPRNTMLYADRVRVGQGAAPHGRRVREQDQRQRDFGEQLDGLCPWLEFDQPKNVVRQQQANRHEGDGRADREAIKPSGEQRV